MDLSTNSNVIIGSQLALAMSMAIGSPVRRPIGTAANQRRTELTKLVKRCEVLKNRSLKLLEGMEEEETRIAFDAASMRSTAGREATKRTGRVIGKMMEQQTMLHARMAKLLDTMIQQLRWDKESHS